MNEIGCSFCNSQAGFGQTDIEEDWGEIVKQLLKWPTDVVKKMVYQFRKYSVSNWWNGKQALPEKMFKILIEKVEATVQEKSTTERRLQKCRIGIWTHAEKKSVNNKGFGDAEWQCELKRKQAKRTDKKNQRNGECLQKEIGGGGNSTDREFRTRSPGAWRSAWQDGRQWPHKLDNTEI